MNSASGWRVSFPTVIGLVTFLISGLPSARAGSFGLNEQSVSRAARRGLAIGIPAEAGGHTRALPALQQDGRGEHETIDDQQCQEQLLKHVSR